MACQGCGPSIWGDGDNKYIKVGDGEFLAVNGSDIEDRMNLKNLRMPYDSLFSTNITLKPGEENYLLNCLTDNSTFLAITAEYDPKSEEKDNYMIYKQYGCNCELIMSQMLVLTGNSTHRIPQLFFTNPNDKYPVKLNVMVGSLDDDKNFFDFKPIIYFTEDVEIENKTSDDPWNTSDGNDFYYDLDLGSYYGYTYSYGPGFDKLDIANLIIDEVRDSNGDVFNLIDDDIILWENGVTISGIYAPGTYSMTFDIVDDYGKYIDPDVNVTIVANN